MVMKVFSILLLFSEIKFAFVKLDFMGGKLRAYTSGYREKANFNIGLNILIEVLKLLI